MTPSYGVKLEIFEGPLDLLLYLIRKEEMDIRDIRISDITREYLEYINLLKELNLEMAGEFLVMASSLLQIKAKMLLPSNAASGEEEEGPDPRAELVAKLIEYQKFKAAASLLSRKEFEAREVYYRDVMPVFAEEDYQLSATLFDLMDAFKDVLKTAGDEVKELIYEEIPLEQKVREILDLLEDKECLHFHEIFSAGRTRRELIITFLALLELIRLKQIVARQPEAFGEIRIYPVRQSPEPSSPAPETGPAGSQGQETQPQ